MFTFGREQELKYAVDFVGNVENAALLIEAINAIHDLLEKKATPHDVKGVLYKSIAEGKSGVWESSGSWLLKVGKEHPEFLEIWEKLAVHKSSRVRFRVAAHIDDLPKNVFTKICQMLLTDDNVKVRSKVAADLYFSNRSDALSFLKIQQERENNEEVLESIKFAIQGIESRA